MNCELEATTVLALGYQTRQQGLAVAVSGVVQSRCSLLTCAKRAKIDRIGMYSNFVQQ
jgi:hypothetical protein